MKSLLLFFFLLTSFMFFMALFQLFFYRNRKIEKRMELYLSAPEVELSPKQLDLFVRFKLARQNIAKKMLTKKKNNKIEYMLARSGLPLKPDEYVVFQLISIALAAMLLAMIAGHWIFLVFGGLLGYLFPGWYLKKKERERMAKFNEGLADMITTIVGSLRAGFSFPQALKSVIEESGYPIKEEMEIVLREMQYGKSLEESLNELKERMPSEDLDLMIQAILIQRQVGGNLATVLDKIVETIRDRTKIQRQIQTLTAQGRLSGIVIGLLPLILGCVLYLMEPTYIGTLFKHPVGMILLAGGGISGVIGFVMIKKITQIEV